MRSSLLFASAALAASLVLSACSGSSSLPSGSQSVAPMGHHGSPQVLALGAKHDTSCPSTFYECFEITKGSPATQEWCIIYSGTSDCTDVYPGTWTWSATVVKVKKGKPTNSHSKHVVASFSPNPGNPTTLTVSTNASKTSHGKIKYAVELNVCNSASSCLGPIDIGISIS